MKPIQSPRRLLGAVLLSASLAFVATGCGDKTSDTAADTTVDAVAPADASDTTVDAVASDTASDTTVEAVTPELDAAGADTGPAGGVKLSDGTAGPEATISISGGQFSPATLTVAAGDIVTFTSGDKGMYSVIVGDLDGATVTGSLFETFTFSEPGTYAVREDLSGSTATITVS